GIAKNGRTKYSNIAMSGTPDPAWMALSSAVYSSVDDPALTTSTVMLGYFFSKPGTAASTVPSQLHTVRVIGSSVGTAPTVGASSADPLQPARAMTAVRAVATAAILVFRT